MEDQKEEYKEMMETHQKEMEAMCLAEAQHKSEWQKELSTLVPDVLLLFNWLEEDHDHWYPHGIVSIYEVPERKNGYEMLKHARIESDNQSMLYMRATPDDKEEAGIDHYYVWQTEMGESGDSYTGYLLLPLNDGRYFKVSYSC